MKNLLTVIMTLAFATSAFAAANQEVKSTIPTESNQEETVKEVEHKEVEHKEEIKK